MGTTRRRSPSRRALALAALALVCAPGCAALGSYRGSGGAAGRWAAEVRRRGVDPATVPDPLAYNEEMQAIARRVAGTGAALERLRRLQDYLFDERDFPFDYASRDTLTAIEAFAERTGNCVSFTNLFIALARSLGLPVRAALLTRPGSAEKEGPLIVVHNHIVAVHRHGGGATVFDFNRRRERPRVGLVLIDDAVVTAIYLNNLGARALVQGRPAEARAHLDEALALAPEFAPIHGNLGIVRRQLGDVQGAFEAYRQALAIVPDSPAILNNLAALYQSLGREAEARAAVEAAGRRGATPYLLIVRGDFARADGRERLALRLYRRAARRAPSLVDPHLAIARLELARGRAAAARRALARAERLDPGNPVTRRLAAEIVAVGGEP